MFFFAAAIRVLFVTEIIIWLPCIKSLLPKNVLIPYIWREVDYVFPSNVERYESIINDSFIPQNVIINDVDVWDDSAKASDTGGKRLFVSTPRMRPGVPAVVSRITGVKDKESFLLEPFPNWSWHMNTEDCSRLISVDKIHIDQCGLLWVLDTGILNEFTNRTRICRPKIVIFDLQNNDQLIEKYEIPDDVFRSGSSLTTTVTDTRTNTCRDSIAYIADLGGNGLIVFDLRQRVSWRIDHTFFYPYPRYGTLTIANVTIDLMDGVFGMALGPISKINGDRILYFHSLASVRESWVPTSVLKIWNTDVQKDKLRKLFNLSEEFREGQSSLEVMTDDGVLIYSVLPKNALACWNIATKASKENTDIILEDPEHLQFISGMKLKNDQLWIATNRIQNEFTSNNNDTLEIKYRVILIKSVSLLLQGSKCLGNKNY